MTRRRFHAPPESFSPDADSVTLSAEETRHLRDVLRLKVDGKVYVFDGTGRDLLYDLLRGGHLSGAILDVFSPEPLPPSSPLWSTPNLIRALGKAASDQS